MAKAEQRLSINEWNYYDNITSIGIVDGVHKSLEFLHNCYANHNRNELACISVFDAVKENQRSYANTYIYSYDPSVVIFDIVSNMSLLDYPSDLISFVVDGIFIHRDA